MDYLLNQEKRRILVVRAVYVLNLIINGLPSKLNLLEKM